MTLIDCATVCAELQVPLATLRRMSRRGEYPELLHVTRGVYRVRKTDHDSWMAARWTSAEMAREEIMVWKAKEALR